MNQIQPKLIILKIKRIQNKKKLLHLPIKQIKRHKLMQKNQTRQPIRHPQKIMKHQQKRPNKQQQIKLSLKIKRQRLHRRILKQTKPQIQQHKSQKTNHPIPQRVLTKQNRKIQLIKQNQTKQRQILHLKIAQNQIKLKQKMTQKHKQKQIMKQKKQIKQKIKQKIQLKTLQKTKQKHKMNQVLHQLQQEVDFRRMALKNKSFLIY